MFTQGNQLGVNKVSTTDLSPELKRSIVEAIHETLSIHPMRIIQPRRMTEHQAAAYLGRSYYWLRNLRKADNEREAEGGVRRGPPFHIEGRNPMYMREDLDAWLDAGGLGG